MYTRHVSLIVMRAALLLLVAGEAGSCGWFSFNTTVDIAPQVIPGDAHAAAAPATTMTVSAIKLDPKNLPSNAGLANSVKLSSLTLKVVMPGSGSFDFLSAVSLTISAPSGSGLPDRQIATGAPKPGARELTLDPTGDVDLLPYVEAGATILVTGTGRAPLIDTTVAGQAVLTVSV
jgi:hypothetical protein